MSLNELQQVIEGLTQAEKIQVLQWVVRDVTGLTPGIESNPGVMGGAACIVRTRIPVWVLVQMQALGASESEILRGYPSLRAEDLTNAWAYARNHQEEIATLIRENEAA